MYFFLSYAHGAPDDNLYVRQLYADLCEDVRLFGGVRGSEDVGFHDGRIRIGMRWSDALVRALATCRVFVALCSPSYFRSEPCGREWSVFLRRLQSQEDTGVAPSAALIPLVWVPTEMPEMAARYQYLDATLGSAYAEHGVRDLVRRPRFRDDYLGFVPALARRIIYLASHCPVPEYTGVDDFDAIESAFHRIDRQGAWSSARHVPISSADPGTRHEPARAAYPPARGRPSVPEDRPILSTYDSPGEPPRETPARDQRGRQDGEDEPAGHDRA